MLKAPSLLLSNGMRKSTFADLDGVLAARAELAASMVICRTRWVGLRWLVWECTTYKARLWRSSHSEDIAEYMSIAFAFGMGCKGRVACELGTNVIALFGCAKAGD